MMKNNSIIKNLMKFIISIIALLILLETLLIVAYFIRNSKIDYIALPYVIGHDYGPIPPWAKDLRLLEPDKSLIWKNRPGVERKYIDIFTPVHSHGDRMSYIRSFFPSSPQNMAGAALWEISLNSDGFRDQEFPKEKPSSAFRIVCLGDSWTFGANVSLEDSYPRQLHRLLQREFPGAYFEVLNLGVLGYSSFQGLELLKKRALGLDPDLMILAFAMNDSSIAGYRDKDIPGSIEAVNLSKKVGNFLDKSETYKLLRYMALTLKYKPESISLQLKTVAESADKPEAAIDYKNMEPWIRVSPADYEKNILQMIEQAEKNNIGLILLYNQLSGDTGDVAGIGHLGIMSPYRKVLEDISRSSQLPLVDSSALISEERLKIEERLEYEKGLRPITASRSKTSEETEVIFRVDQGSNSVSKRIYISGTHLKLGNAEPNKVKMYDDGTHGDQRAGDRVWSYAAAFPPGTKIFYVYTNSGAEGKWEGLDVPYIRSVSVDSQRGENKIYLPIETFGKVYMQADSWHTNARGYKLIASALLEKIKHDEKFKSYIPRLEWSNRDEYNPGR
jgi:lysophospholipase L1-like esterase